MRTKRKAVVILLTFGISQCDIHAITRFVAPGGLHISPFTNWANAATDIQSAISVAVNNDTILVSNGVYNIASTILLNKRVTLKSVNGQEVTTINGGNSKRCVNLSSQAAIDGFSITGGYALSGAGIFSSSGTIVNCFISNNSAYSNSLRLTGFGAGVVMEYSTMSNSIVANNQAEDTGGGIDCRASVVLDRVSVLNNTAKHGGGLSLISELDKVIVNNCLVAGNQASSTGGGIFDFGIHGNSLMHCTVVNNSAGGQGGGIIFYFDQTRVTNSIVYFNSAGSGSNYFASVTSMFSYSCTAPLPAGTMNISSNPLFAQPQSGDYRLQSSSPCIDTGINIAGIATDRDGLPRNLDGNFDGITAPDMGCYEFWNASGYLSENNEVIIKWAGATNRKYSILATTNLFSPFYIKTTGIVGRTPINTYTNNNVTDSEFTIIAIE